jgi:hypothetical protein
VLGFSQLALTDVSDVALDDEMVAFLVDVADELDLTWLPAPSAVSEQGMGNADW